MSAYLIGRSANSNSYLVWKFSLANGPTFEEVPLDSSAQLESTHKIAQVGGYMLQWGAGLDAVNGKNYPYKLLEFNPTLKDPLNGPAVQQGVWSSQKFWNYRSHYSNDPHEQDHLPLYSMGNFMLFFVGGEGRGTYMLYNFDPNPAKPNSSDPLPSTYLPQGGFPTIQKGHDLIYLNNYVLDRHIEKSAFRIWSFDPQNPVPLSIPEVNGGKWDQITAKHRVIGLGDHLLTWIPGEREYTIWSFSPTDKEPLKAVVSGEELPCEMAEYSSLTYFQTKEAVSSSQPAPGTMDYFRTKIKHVVFYMLESRSFDNVVGWLYEKDRSAIHTIGKHHPYVGVDPDFYNWDGDKKVYPKKFNDGKPSEEIDLSDQHQDPFHDNSDGLRQMFYEKNPGYPKSKPDMRGFVSNNSSTDVMNTLTPEQLPILNGLAENFASSDEWFSSVPGGTDINRSFSVNGSAMNRLDTWEGGSIYANWPQYPRRQSLWKVLWGQGIKDWKIYNAITWPLGPQGVPFTYHLYLQGQIPSVDYDTKDHIDSVDNFIKQAQEGKLPAFSFLEPVWIAPNGTTSYHPGSDLVPAEMALNDIYEAIKNGPAWEETLFVVTFSKPGGICDHVPPPYAKKPWPNDLRDGFRFDLMGPRVPAIMVSPWVKPNTVFRSAGEVPYDATSFAATLLHWFGIPKNQWGLGERMDAAPTFESVFEEEQPRKDAPTLTPPSDKSFPSKK